MSEYFSIICVNLYIYECSVQYLPNFHCFQYHIRWFTQEEKYANWLYWDQRYFMEKPLKLYDCASFMSNSLSYFIYCNNFPFQQLLNAKGFPPEPKLGHLVLSSRAEPRVRVIRIVSTLQKPKRWSLKHFLGNLTSFRVRYWPLRYPFDLRSIRLHLVI